MTSSMLKINTQIESNISKKGVVESFKEGVLYPVWIQASTKFWKSASTVDARNKSQSSSGVPID